MKTYDVQLVGDFEAESPEQAVVKFILWVERYSRELWYGVHESGTLGGYPREYESLDAAAIAVEEFDVQSNS